MAKAQISSRIPKKYAKAKKSFLNRIGNDLSTSNIGSFCAFPLEMSFNGQDEGEDVILLFRQHPIVFVPKVALALLLLILSLFSGAFFNALSADVGLGLVVGVSVMLILLSITILVDSFLKWFFSVHIITSDRIVDLDFSNILFHRFSETQLEKIEDVSHAPIGFLSSIFDFGHIYVQTAGTQREFEFLNVPRPRDIQDTLFDLLEMKQKKQI